MLRALADWILAFLGMARELQKQRALVSKLEERIRNLEESLHLLIQEERHARELQAVKNEKLLLEIEKHIAERAAAPPPRKRGKAQ